MKRILHIIGAMDRAGAETMLMNLYRVLDKNRFQFDFLYFTEKKCDFDDEIKQQGGKIFRITEQSVIKRTQKTILLLKKHQEWQTVHAATMFSNCFHLYAAKRAGVAQRISHIQNDLDITKRVPFVSALYHRWSRYVQLKYSTDFLACSLSSANYMFPSLRAVQIFYNAIDVMAFAQQTKNRTLDLKQAYDLPTDMILLLQVGRLHEQKNHGFSFSIIKGLKKTGKKCKLFLAGQGHLETELKQRAKNLGLEKEIIFLGNREDVPQLMAAADVLLMPSLFEGLPLTLIEAQAAGLPALISDEISNEVDVDLGLLHFASLKKPPKYWAREIRKILATPRKRTISERIEKVKAAGFDINKSVCNLEAVYKRDEP